MDDTISGRAAIDTEGLDAQIRCEMCRNSMHTDRGCDGNCKYDEKLYERIMQILGERIKPLPSARPEQSEPEELDFVQPHKKIGVRLEIGQSERKKGKWIHGCVNSEHSATGYFILRSCECSECGAICEQESNFCPNCGADMKGKETK